MWFIAQWQLHARSLQAAQQSRVPLARLVVPNIEAHGFFLSNNHQQPLGPGALEYLREGDLFLVHSMDRLARSVDDLRKIVLDLTKKGVHVQFVKENLTFTGADSPMSNLLLSLLGAVAEFERSMIRERQREGIALAKKAGIYKGRKPSLTPAQVAELRKRVVGGEKKTALAAEYRISRQTLYSALG